MGDSWTAKERLPGGDIADADFDTFFAALKQRYSWMPVGLLHHYARCYGSQTPEVLGAARSVVDLGQHFGSTLYACEIDYLRKAEWVTRADDLLDRRTKHGLHLTAIERAAVEKAFQ